MSSIRDISHMLRSAQRSTDETIRSLFDSLQDLRGIQRSLNGSLADSNHSDVQDARTRYEQAEEHLILAMDYMGSARQSLNDYEMTL